MNNEQREIADICVYEKNWPTFLAFCFQLFFKRAIRNSLRKIFKSDRIRSWKEERRERNIFYKNILISIYRSLIMQITFLTTHPAKMFPFSEQTNNETLTYTFYLQSVHGKCFSTTRNKERFLSMTKTIEKLARKAERMQPARWWRVATYHGLEFPPDSPKRMIFEISHFSYNTAVVINRGNNGGEREKTKQKKKK